MDSENVVKVELRQLRKRNGEKVKGDDSNMNNYHKTDEAFLENIIQKKQIGKRKRKSTVEETEDSLEQLDEISNDISTDKDISKEDADENAKTAKKPSKRQLKREKAIQMAAQKKQTSKINAMQKALSYVSMWKHSRSEWKFEKLKQIWLIDNLLDENSIPDAIFPVVLEYFEGCKGMAREVLLRMGMDVIRKAEEEEDEKNKDDIMQSIAYKRARQLLQALPTDSNNCFYSWGQHTTWITPSEIIMQIQV